MKKKILVIIACILAVLTVLSYNYLDEDTTEFIETVQNAVNTELNEIDDVVVSEETQSLVNYTIESIENDEDISTTEVIESSEEEEQGLEEEYLELDGVVEQENISYNGDNTGTGTSLLGAYQGLTYYSQADSRWASVVYTSTGNSSQTIKSSGCGPTSAAMVVSSSKGAILPTTMAQLAVDNGYRTANNGTAWAYFSFVADYFDFEEFYTTYNYDTMLSYLTQKNSDGTSKYYVIVSCGSGLFTSGGHYIVLVADNDGTITVYDPYLYSGKFDTASRRNAGAVVSGNSVYVTEEAFKEYANYRCFWIFSNDEGEGNTSNIELFNAEVNCSEQSVNYTRYVSTKASNLNVRSGAGMSHSVLTTIPKGTAVTVTGVSGNWSYITSPVSGWVSTAYLSSTAVTYTENYVTTINAYYRLKSRTKLYANSAMSGTSYNYLAKTQIKVISHVSNTVDYIYVPATR